VTRWTNDAIFAEASKYETRGEFRKAAPGAYKAAWRRKILDQVCGHMAVKVSWSPDWLAVEALKYTTRGEFGRCAPGAIRAARGMGILDEICGHMVSGRTIKWTEESVRAEAKRFKNRSAFRSNSGSAANAAVRLGIFGEVTSHMNRPKSHRYKWTEEALRVEALKYNTIRDFRAASSGAYDAVKKRKLMHLTDHMNRLQISWTDEMLRTEALKHNTKTDFTRAYPGVFNVARKRGVWDEICSHMESGLVLSATKWTDEEIFQEALKHSSISEFQITPAGRAARRRKLMTQACAHMIKVYKYWTDEDLAAEARKYGTRSEFNENSPNARAAAQARDLMDSICSHMEVKHETWTEAKVRERSAEFAYRSEFERGLSGAYKFAKQHGILEDVCAHMEYRPSSDDDAIYIWRAAGGNSKFNGKLVYKVGITSARLGERRVHKVARDHGFVAEIIVLARVSCRAHELEQLILQTLGDDPNYLEGDGRTEFRALDDLELAESIELIQQYEV